MVENIMPKGDKAGDQWWMDVLGQDVLARRYGHYRYKVGCFGQILFQHGKKLHMKSSCFYTFS